jgi:two-component system, NtrC family, sensor kinase
MTSASGKPESARLLARADDLRQAERRAASARMVSVAGHLIGTPLNVIAGRASLIRSNPSPEAVEANVRRIEEQVERLALRIRRLIDYFGLPQPGSERRSVADLILECSELYGPVAELKGVELELTAQGVETLSVEATVPPLVLTTLLSLAVRSTAAAQCVRLAATEHGPKTVAFELSLPGLDAPPANFDRLEPPEHGLRYDPGALEAFWTCLGLARRLGGDLKVTEVASGSGVTVRFECPHA